MSDNSDHIEVSLVISSKAYEKAQALFAEKDPLLSILGEWREVSTIDDMLGLLLEERLLGSEF